MRAPAIGAGHIQHLGEFLQEFTPAGRGFKTSFGFLGGYETYDTHMVWNGRWNLTRDRSGALNGGYTGPYITDLYETDHPVTDPKYNGTCTSAGVCTCAGSRAGEPQSNICRYSSYMYTQKSIELIAGFPLEVPQFWYFAIQSVHSPYQVRPPSPSTHHTCAVYAEKTLCQLSACVLNA